MNKYEEYFVKFEDESEKKSTSGAIDVFYDIADSIKTAVIFVTVLFLFFVRSVCVEGDSMNPTLESGNWVAVTAFGADDYDYGDIVVVSEPWERNVPIIKRVIGKAGDVIDIDPVAGTVTRNGEVLEENYIAEETHLIYDGSTHFEVPEGRFFVMGDNRNDSLDSRSKKIGYVESNYILGKALVRILPFGKWKI